jgi:hypothetical protein
VALVQVTLLMERSTAARRDAVGDSEFLCRGGMKDMIAGLAAGQLQEVQTPPEGVGRTFEVGDGKRAQPEERPEADWRPAVAEKRARLEQDLAGLLASFAPRPGQDRGSLPLPLLAPVRQNAIGREWTLPTCASPCSAATTIMSATARTRR